MLATYICHAPSGAAANQFLHYGDEIEFGYFGRRIDSWSVPPDFRLHQITTPLSLHYSPIDPYTNPIDVRKLISKLSGSKRLQTYVIDQIKFHHVDFVWGIQAANLVYSNILKFFDENVWAVAREIVSSHCSGFMVIIQMHSFLSVLWFVIKSTSSCDVLSKSAIFCFTHWTNILRIEDETIDSA